MSVYSFEHTIQAKSVVEFSLGKQGLGEGGNMNRVLRLVKEIKGSNHDLRGKRGTESAEHRALRAGTGVKGLGWYLADNIYDVRVRKTK